MICSYLTKSFTNDSYSSDRSRMILLLCNRSWTTLTWTNMSPMLPSCLIKSFMKNLCSIKWPTSDSRRHGRERFVHFESKINKHHTAMPGNVPIWTRLYLKAARSYLAANQCNMEKIRLIRYTLRYRMVILSGDIFYVRNAGARSSFTRSLPPHGGAARRTMS